MQNWSSRKLKAAKKEPQAARAEDEEGQHQLDEEHGAGGEFQQTVRHLRGVPRKGRGERLRQEVIRQRRQIPPAGIAAQELDHARHEHEAEHQPAQKPDARNRGEAQQKRSKPHFQKEQVPLIAHEDLPGIKQREIEGKEQKQTKTRQHVHDQQQRQTGSRPAHGLDGGVAVFEPEDHRHQEVALRPVTLGEVLGELGHGLDAVPADEPLRLHGEGNESCEVDET